MSISKGVVFLAATLTFAAAGCSMDVAKQLASNTQMRDQVMGAIAGNADMAMQAVDKIIANDSLRTQVVDHLLQNDGVAQQVLGRIAGNENALGMVVGMAVRDTTMSKAIMTIVKKGMDSAAKGSM